MSWRNSREYRIWRAGVVMRDKRCQICNTLQNRHAHHMNHATYFPEERFDIENGICLCRSCHSHFHNDFKRSTREKCTKYDFNNYNALNEYFKTLGDKNDN